MGFFESDKIFHILPSLHEFSVSSHPKKHQCRAIMEQKTYDVFISYSRKDYVDEKNNVIPGNEVSKIKEALTNAGITYWFDEEGVYAGDKFAKVIVRNIKASSIFVFLSTKNSNRSEWTANEISTAHMLGKKIIPVRIDDSVFHDDVILYIARLSHIDYFNNPDEGRRELTRSIKDYLEDVKTVEVQKAVDEQRRKEELERQRRQQEEEKKRQARIEKIETEIAALESQRTERKKAVLQKEQELKLAQVDLEACETKIQKLQNKLQELREPKKKVESDEKQSLKEANAKEKVFTVGNVSFKMICVEGGRFQMGSSESDSEAFDNEKPQHWVELNDYYIGETVVTQALWKAVMRGGNPSRFKGDLNLPVDSVAWKHDEKNVSIKYFLQELNECLDKKKQLPEGCKFRLPTETEWEYAARGGQKDDNGYKYSGSNNLLEVAWYGDNSDKKTHPVKEKRPNELGLYDMSGNVWEWCCDCYRDYANIAKDNTKSSDCVSDRVLRGGSWRSPDGSCRVAYRRYYAPSYRSFNIGFRLALS